MISLQQAKILSNKYSVDIDPEEETYLFEGFSFKIPSKWLDDICTDDYICCEYSLKNIVITRWEKQFIRYYLKPKNEKLRILNILLEHFFPSYKYSNVHTEFKANVLDEYDITKLGSLIVFGFNSTYRCDISVRCLMSEFVIAFTRYLDGCKTVSKCRTTIDHLNMLSM